MPEIDKSGIDASICFDGSRLSAEYGSRNLMQVNIHCRKVNPVSGGISVNEGYKLEWKPSTWVFS